MPWLLISATGAIWGALALLGLLDARSPCRTAIDRPVAYPYSAPAASLLLVLLVSNKVDQGGSLYDVSQGGAQPNPDFEIFFPQGELEKLWSWANSDT